MQNTAASLMGRGGGAAILGQQCSSNQGLILERSSVHAKLRTRAQQAAPGCGPCSRMLLAAASGHRPLLGMCMFSTLTMSQPRMIGAGALRSSAPIHPPQAVAAFVSRWPESRLGSGLMVFSPSGGVSGWLERTGIPGTVPWLTGLLTLACVYRFTGRALFTARMQVSLRRMLLSGDIRVSFSTYMIHVRSGTLRGRDALTLRSVIWSLLARCPCSPRPPGHGSRRPVLAAGQRPGCFYATFPLARLLLPVARRSFTCSSCARSRRWWQPVVLLGSWLHAARPATSCPVICKVGIEGNLADGATRHHAGA